MRRVRTSAVALAVLTGLLGACRGASPEEATASDGARPASPSTTSTPATTASEPVDGGRTIVVSEGEIRINGSVVGGPGAGAAPGTIVGSGAIVTEARPMSGFRALDLGTVGRVQVDITGREMVEVEADDNVVGLVRTEVVGGRLAVRLAEGTTVRNATLRLRVQAAALDEVVVDGSTDVGIRGLAGARFGLVLRGAGEAQLSGAADELLVDVEGSGNVRAVDVTAQRAAVRVSGRGDVALPAVQTLSATIEGSGDVTYRGSPAISRSVTGSGDVEPG